MSIVDTLKQAFTATERVVYRCDVCGETFDVAADVEEPVCPACDSTVIRQINRA